MPFFEPLSIVQHRSRAQWERGTADFHALDLPGKTVAATAGVGGAVGGLAWGAAKTIGVSGFEFYSKSFGDMRGRTAFDYFSSAPIIQVSFMAAFAYGAGLALQHFGIVLPWNIIPTTFLAGATTYLGAYITRHLPDVVGAVSPGVAGHAMSWVHAKLHPAADAAQPEPKATLPHLAVRRIMSRSV